MHLQWVRTEMTVVAGSAAGRPPCVAKQQGPACKQQCLRHGITVAQRPQHTKPCRTSLAPCTRQAAPMLARLQAAEPVRRNVAAAVSHLGSLPAGMRPCCMAGTLAEGTPQGTITQLGGVDCYVSKPPAWKEQGAGSGQPAPRRVPTLLLYPDVFGITFINTQLMADRLAAAGFLVVVVNILKGAAMPPAAMESMLQLARPDLMTPPGNTPSWWDTWVLGPVGKAQALLGLLSTFPFFLLRQGGPPPTNCSMLPVMDAVLKEVKEGKLGPVGKVGACGFCFGGGFALLHAGLRDAGSSTAAGSSNQGEGRQHLVDAFMVAHTTIKVPDYLTPLQRPGLFIAAADDFAFDDEARARAEQLIPSLAPSMKIVHFPGTYHGFMIRGDPRNQVIRDAKEDGTLQTIEWFRTHLSG